jgi:hypothetical protein
MRYSQKLIFRLLTPNLTQSTEASNDKVLASPVAPIMFRACTYEGQNNCRDVMERGSSIRRETWDFAP